MINFFSGFFFIREVLVLFSADQTLFLYRKKLRGIIAHSVGFIPSTWDICHVCVKPNCATLLANKLSVLNVI